MSQQLFEDGKVISADGVELECVGVSYQEDPETNTKHSFGYTFRLKSEMDIEREQEEAARLALEANEVPAEPVEPLGQPEENKEETLNVK